MTRTFAVALFALAVPTAQASAFCSPTPPTASAENFTTFQHVDCAGAYIGFSMLLSAEVEVALAEVRAHASLMRAAPPDNPTLLQAAEQSAMNIGRTKAQRIVDASEGRPRNAALYALVEEVRACDAAYGYELTAPLFP